MELDGSDPSTTVIDRVSARPIYTRDPEDLSPAAASE